MAFHRCEHADVCLNCSTAKIAYRTRCINAGGASGARGECVCVNGHVFQKTADINGKETYGLLDPHIVYISDVCPCNICRRKPCHSAHKGKCQDLLAFLRRKAEYVNPI